jgi:hypothetical protein
MIMKDANFTQRPFYFFCQPVNHWVANLNTWGKLAASFVNLNNLF